MKKVLIAFSLFVLFVIVADRYLPSFVIAQNQTPSQPVGMCYSQCGVYKFYWRGDYCYDLVQQTCTASFNLKDVVSMVKSIRSAFLTGKLTEIVDVKQIFTAWLICKPLIEDCIAPQLDACQTTCQSNSVAYAPNLTVGSEFGLFHGLYYNDDNKTLTIRAMNTGLGYAWDIGVSVSYGYTSSQDGSGLTGGTYVSETIPELLFFGSRQAAPKSVTDTITDFLIDESNFSGFLSRFKSDADNRYIPPGWEKTIPFIAPEGKLTRVILNIDPNQDIVETNESDNTYILDIDKRPKPPFFDITNIDVIRQGNTLTDYLVRFTVKNSGELAGDAKLSLYEGNSDDGQNPFHSETKRVFENDSTLFEKSFTVDVSDGSPSCAKSKRYTATVTDDKGFVRTVHFEIPLYAGVITGRVTNTKGKPVIGATVTTNTGQTTTTSDYGFYRIKGIPILGKVTVTISHPSYTETQTKEALLSLDTSTKMKACDANGLTVPNIDAVLRDKPVKLIVRLKNKEGNLLNGNALLTGGAGSKMYEISGEKVIDEADVGQFSVTASSPGYITKFIQSMLTPPEQTLEILLEKLNGRPNDEGLTLMPPVKLWEKTLSNKVDDIEGAKNGTLLVFYTSKNTQNSGELHFINPVNGQLIKSVSVPSTKGQQQEGLDVSYDGRTVGYMVNPGIFGKTDTEKIVKVFGKNGNEFASTTVDKKNSSKMSVSPDGFYLYPTSLMNNTLYKYTRLEMEGVGEKALQTYAASEELDFLRDNTIIASCKTGLCIKSLSDLEIRGLGKTNGAVRVVDASNDNSTIIVRTDKGIERYGTSAWKKELERHHAFVSSAISPGGDYVIVAKGNAGDIWQTLSVFDADGRDVTPKFDYKDVRYVEANDRGLFFTSVKSNKVSYFQIGKYDTPYNPPESSDETIQNKTTDLELYVNSDHEFKDTGYAVSWDTMVAGVMYKTKKQMTIPTPWGNLIVGAGTVFAKGVSGEPMLVWGQAEVQANTPITMVVIKSKIFEGDIMAEKVGRYWLGTLPESDYVLIRNLHTRYEAKSNSDGVSVSVIDGSVRVQSKGIIKEVNKGQRAKVVGDTMHVGVNWMQYISWVIITLFCIIVSFFCLKYFQKKKGHK